MSVMCNSCGRLSQDHEFCDSCNVDLTVTTASLPPECCPLSPSGVQLTLEQRQILSFPEASLLVQGLGEASRLHWISAKDWVEHGPRIEKRLSVQFPSLPTGRLIEVAQGRWLIYDTSVNSVRALTLPRLDDPIAELERLSKAVHSLAQTLGWLHQHSLLWLNFDPQTLEDIGPLEGKSAPVGLRRLHITNLDLELFPFGVMPERVRVHPSYAAPEIVQFRAVDIGPRTDVYHLTLFVYYWLAGRFPDGLSGGGLERYHYELPFLRIFAPHLPVGIIPVLERGLSIQPDRRHATPRAFAHALDAGIARAKERSAAIGPFRWDVGGETRAGRAKQELQRGNEDTVLIKDDGAATLVAVADGVSTCDIGSGGLASVMTTIVIENAFGAGCTHESFAKLIATATTGASTGLLEWALAHNCRAELEAGRDLMGTTLTVGWLQDCELSIANLGDSRAYLVTADAIEQLTVDGDLASDLLSQGVAPEEVLELGAMARSLRECVGGCTRSPDGELAILPESTQPKVTRWPLAIGDVIVLCSDGLVEEGFFLEPHTVAAIVRESKDRPAAEIAHLLVEAADSLQRVPTVLEPDGFGDNISCVVVKIKDTV